MSPSPTDSLRLQRGAQHVHDLGPRAVAELLVQVVHEGRDLVGTLALLDEWRAGLSVEMMVAVRGERFPPRILLQVPA